MRVGGVNDPFFNGVTAYLPEVGFNLNAAINRVESCSKRDASNSTYWLIVSAAGVFDLFETVYKGVSSFLAGVLLGVVDIPRALLLVGVCPLFCLVYEPFGSV